MLEFKPNPLIYFLVSSDYNLLLFQLAFLLKAKTIITAKQKTDKIIDKIKLDNKNHNNEYLELLLGRNLIKKHNSMLYKRDKLVFASDSLYRNFKCKNLEDVNDKVSSKFNLKQLLFEDSVIVDKINNDEDTIYMIKSITINDKYEKIIYLEQMEQEKAESKELNFISSRISYIELLKDKLLEKSISDSSYSIVTIQIDDNKSRVDVDNTETENILKEFLIFTNSILNENIIFSQYDKNFYITLFENVSFDKLKERAKYFNTKMLSFFSEQKIHPIISIFVYDVNNLELNEVLSTLENISYKRLTNEQIESESLHFVSSIQENMSDSEIINSLLDSAFVNKTTTKLLNIYKGLVVNTPSNIVKKIDNKVYVSFEQLQGIVMHSERETVLQFSGHAKDIRANIAYIDLQKKIAILDNFKFLNSNANSRKYSRVTSSTRTPIVMSFLGGTLHGDISDISVNSIAIKTKHTKRLDTIKSKKISLIFNLPSYAHIDGSVKLNLVSTVSLVSCDDNGFCKLVCELDEEVSSESILVEYVYSRQKELILELKKIAKSI